MAISAKKNAKEVNISLAAEKKIRQKRKTKNEVVQPVTSEVDSIELSTIIKKSRKKRVKVVKDNIEDTINSIQDTVNQNNDEIINVSKEELLATIIPNKSDINVVVNSSFNQELEYALNHSEILCIPDSFESDVNQDSDIEYNISEDLGNIFDTNFDNVSDNDDVIIISDSNMIINDIKAKDIKVAELVTNTVNDQNDVENISAFIKQHSQNSRNNDQVTLCTDQYNYLDNSTLNSSDIVSNNQDSVNIVNNNDSTIASLSVSAEAANKVIEKNKVKAIKMLKIRKRDGRIVDFDTSKIFNALKHAFQNVTNDNELDDDIDDEMLSSLVSKIIGSIKKQAKILDDNILPVETIQDIIEDTLLKVKQFEVAKTFIRYRANRTQMREANNDLISLYKKIHNASSEELEIKRDNANVNGNASMGVMLKLGTESNKYFLLEHVLKKEYAQAHKEGYIHIHDLDMSNVTYNCLVPDTELVIKHNGHIIFTDFHYFDQYLLNNNISNINDIQILSKNGKFIAINKVFRRLINEDIYKISFNNGKNIFATADHLLTVNNIELKAVKDIQINDRIEITTYPAHNQFNAINEINLIDLFGPNSKILIANWLELCQKYSIPNGAWRQLAQKNRNLKHLTQYFSLQDYFSLRHQFNIDEHDIKLIYIKSRYNTTINAILPVTMQLGKIIGYILTESSIRRQDAITIFANTNTQLINDFSQCMDICFPQINYKIIEPQQNNTSPCTFIKIYSRIFAELFNDILAYKKHSNDISLPDWFKFCNNQFISGFLAAVIDGDGSVTTSSNGMVSIGSTSYNFIKGIIDILAINNITAKYECQHIKDSTSKFISGIIAHRNFDLYQIRFLNKNINQLQQLLQGNCYKFQNFNKVYQKNFICKVVKIELVPYQGYVYDFETEDHHFSANGIISHNCCQINLQKLFKSGFSTGHGYLRSPNSIRSYASLACIAIQSNQNEMFGGQSINLFDFYMSDGVRKSFKKAFKHNILIAAKTILKGSNLFDAYVEIVEDRLLPKYLDQNSLEIAIQDFLNNNDEDTYSDQIIVRCFKFAFDQACKDVEEETHQAMEALVHNFNTLASRAGSQVPFSSINFGCDTSHEGRLVTKEVLNAVYAGLGRGETSIFPICVFQMKAGINYNPEDPNYDLFQQSIKCSAKRLFPTYMSEDATYNAQYYDPKNIQTLCATMG